MLANRLTNKQTDEKRPRKAAVAANKVAWPGDRQVEITLHQRGKKQLTVDVLPMLLLVDGHLMSLLVLSRSSQIQRLSDALGMRHIPPTNMFPLVNGQPNRHLTSDGQPPRLQSLPNKKRSRLLISCYWSRIALPYGHWWHRFTHLPPSRHQTHAHRRFH